MAGPSGNSSRNRRRPQSSIASTARARAMDRKWRIWGTLGVLVALAVGGSLGFIVLPVVQGRAAGIDAFTAICRAVGILPGSPARPTPLSRAAAQPVPLVSWSPATFNELYRADRANGARIAEERC